MVAVVKVQLQKVCVVAHYRGRVLLVRDRRYGDWSPPTGGIKGKSDVWEAPGDWRGAGKPHPTAVRRAAVASARELYEETLHVVDVARGEVDVPVESAVVVPHRADASRGQPGGARVQGMYYVAYVDLAPIVDGKFRGDPQAMVDAMAAVCAARAAGLPHEESIVAWRFEPASGLASARDLWAPAKRIFGMPSVAKRLSELSASAQ